MNLNLWKACGCALYSGRGDEEFPPSAQILFSDNFPLAYAAEDAAYIGDVVLDYMKSAVR